MKRVKSVLMSAILASTMVVTNFAGAIPSGVLAATPAEEAKESIGTAQKSVSDVPQNDITAQVPVNDNEPSGDTKEVSTQDVKTELSTAKTSLGAAEENLGEAESFAAELEKEDNDGKRTGLIADAAGSLKEADEAVNNAMKAYLEPELDENGKIIYIDELDENGNVVLDAGGNPKKLPKYKVVAFEGAYTTTDKDAGDAISAANDANTLSSESAARAAATTAQNELANAEVGLTAADNAIVTAQQAVKAAQEKYDAAFKAAQEASEKYDDLKSKYAEAQTNATAATEHLKAAEKNANALAEKANDAYLEYTGAKNNQEVQELLNDIAGYYDNMLAAEGDANKAADSNKYWDNANKLSLSLLKYYILTDKLTAYDYDNKDADGKPVAVKYGSDFKFEDKFEVTLTSSTNPDEEVTYTLEKGKGWKDANVLEKFVLKDSKGNPTTDKNATFSENGFIYAGENYAGNRTVVSFKDKNGEEHVFYFNYKNNNDGRNNQFGSIYIYQKLFRKTADGTGIEWEGDLSSNREAQARAINDGQLSKGDAYGRFSNATEANGNFSYEEAMNKKKLADKMNAAKSDIVIAGSKTEAFNNKVDKRVIDYCGIVIGDEKKEPNNHLFGSLRELDQDLKSLKDQLTAAQEALKAALEKKGSLEEKFKAAKEAVAAIDLSRFGGSSDDDADSDDAGSDDVSNISVVPLTQDAIGVFGARTPRVAGGGAVADRGVAGVRQAGADNTGAQNNINNANAVNTEGTATTKKLADNTVPLAANVEASSTSSMNYIWLLAVAAAVAIVAGVYVYDKRKKALANSAKGQK